MPRFSVTHRDVGSRTLLRTCFALHVLEEPDRVPMSLHLYVISRMLFKVLSEVLKVLLFCVFFRSQFVHKISFFFTMQVGVGLSGVVGDARHFEAMWSFKNRRL